MKVLALGIVALLGFFSAGCSVPATSSRQLTGDEAVIELRSTFAGHTNRPLSLKLVSIDGQPPGRWGGFKRKFVVPPGRHTVRVTGEFENMSSTVDFSLNARARQTYWIGGQFALRHRGYLKHIYTLQDSRGNVLQRREVVP